MYSYTQFIDRITWLLGKEESRDVLGARACTNIDTGNTQMTTTTCQYNDKYPITFGNRSINECQNRSALKAVTSSFMK